MSEALESVWRVRSESNSLERLDGETILINFDSGAYFSFRGPAADILWLIDSGVDRSHWSQILTAAFSNLSFDAEVNSQVEAFLKELKESGIIFSLPGSGGPPVPLPEDYQRIMWTPPTVEAVDDLADLLLIDPIHDVGDDGWPNTPQN